MRLRLLALILIGLLVFSWFSMNGKQQAGGEFSVTLGFVAVLLGIGWVVNAARK